MKEKLNRGVILLVRHKLIFLTPYKMKNKRTVLALLLLGVLVSSPFLSNNIQAQGQQGMRQGPPGIELPSDWDDMTETERQTYMEDNKPDGAPEGGPSGGGQGNHEMGGTPPGMELPSDWETMTETEQQAYIEDNKPEDGQQGEQGEGQGNRGMGGTPPNVDLPDDWDDMTEDERRAYMEANKPAEKDSSKIQPRNSEVETNGKARKGRNYKKFSGTLKEAKNFTDTSDIENKTAVSYLQQRGVIDGYEDGSFGPSNPINRAESLKVLFEALGEDIADADTQKFSDVPVEAWFSKYVNKAKTSGIAEGYSDGTFQPAATVNQVELLKLAFESFGIDLTGYAVTSSDIDQSAWYASYMQYALDNSLLDAGSIAPGEGITRDAFSEVLYRLIQQQEGL